MSQPPYGNQPPQGGQPPYGGQPGPGGSQSGWGPTNPPTPPSPTGQPGFGQQPTAAQPGYGPPTGAQPGFGAPPTQQFGQPAAGGYGSPPGGQPPYGGGPGGPYGSPPPAKKSPLPFIIGGLVLLLIAGGVGLFFALKEDEPTPVAQTTTQSTQSTEETEESSEDTEESTEDTDDSPSGDDPNFDDSVSLADAFLELMIAGDYEAARFTLCEDGLDMFADGAALAADFFDTLGATSVTGGQSTAIEPDGSDRDTVTYDLETDVGTVALDVSVFEEDGSRTVCGYSTP